MALDAEEKSLEERVKEAIRVYLTEEDEEIANAALQFIMRNTEQPKGE